MHSIEFLQDFTVVVMTAAIVTVIFRRLGQPVVLGYIIAGLIMGPRTPPFSFIHDEEIIHSLADLGIILLMFALGLHFSLRKLKKVGGAALVAGVLEILFMLWIGDEVGHFFGWNDMDSLFLGAILSISSTTIIVKVLQDLGRAHEKFAELIFGILIIEDILAIALLALLSGFALTGTIQKETVFVTLGKLTTFLVLVLVLGLLTVPRLLQWVAKFESNELILMVSLGLCFGVSLLAVQLGYSEALGAFLIGAVIAESKVIGRIETLIEPVRDLFSAIFFVSVGLIIDPKLIVQYALPIGMITLAVVVGKVVTCSFGTYVGGNSPKTALRVGMGLAQIGEFSFIIASLGLTLGVTSEFLFPIVVTVSALTTLLTPYLIRNSDKVVEGMGNIVPTKLAALFELYPRWLQNIQQRQKNPQTRGQISKPIGTIFILMILISAIFIGANYVAENKPKVWPGMPVILHDPNFLCWLGAMLLSIPFLAVTFRKIWELGSFLARLSFTTSPLSEKHRALLQGLIANIILLTGVVGVALWILVLSSTMYPQGLVLIFLLLFFALIALIFGRTFLKIYSKAESLLQETLAESKHPS